MAKSGANLRRPPVFQSCSAMSHCVFQADFGSILGPFWVYCGRSKPSPLAASINGSARPKLLLLPNGQPLLAGGRPGLFLWLGDATATAWTPINVAEEHNRLTEDEPTWQYSDSFATGGHPDEGLPCQTGNTVPRPAGSTSYTSLLQVAPDEFLLQYCKLQYKCHLLFSNFRLEMQR